jgi:hypothetical protein
MELQAVLDPPQQPREIPLQLLRAPQGIEQMAVVELTVPSLACLVMLDVTGNVVAEHPADRVARAD